MTSGRGAAGVHGTLIVGSTPVGLLRSMSIGGHLAAIRQVCPIAAHSTERPGVATWARGHGEAGRDPAGDGRRCPAASKRFFAAGHFRSPVSRSRTLWPVAPASRRGHGDVSSAPCRDPVGAGPSPNGTPPASRRGHGAMVRGRPAIRQVPHSLPATPRRRDVGAGATAAAR